MSEKKLIKADIQYPENIYDVSDKYGNRITTDSSSAYGRFAELGYRTGLEDGMKLAKAECLDGYSNLTEAISQGMDIDWTQLDKRKAKCYSEFGVIWNYLKRCRDYPENSVGGWYLDSEANTAWTKALIPSWNGESGWSLWIEGGIPVKLPKADTLEPGSVFVGKNLRITKPREFVVAHSPYPDEEDKAVAYPIGVLDGDCFYASGVDVIEVKSGRFKEGQ